MSGRGQGDDIDAHFAPIGQGERDARTMSMMLNVLLAGMCDPSRLGRGRTYARQGAVVDLEVLPGEVRAAVQGSRSEPYRVTIRTELIAVPLTLISSVPDRREVRFDCTCPDWEDPCKHGVAVMSWFAELVSDDPGLLLTWRGVSRSDDGPRAVIGSRSAGSSAAPLPLQDPGPLDDEQRARLREFLGNDVRLELPVVATLAAPREAWDQPWTMMLEEAIEVLGNPRGRR